MIFYPTAIKNKNLGANLHFFCQLCNKKRKKVFFFFLLLSLDYIKEGEYLSDALLKIICTRVRVSA